MNLKAKKNKSVRPASNQILVVYVPVIHEGYRQLFSRFPDVKELWLIGHELAHELRALQKDIRALDPAQVKKLLSTWQQFKTIEILTPKNLATLQKTTAQLVFANDELSRHVMKKYFPEHRVLFDTAFLMWDEKSSLKETEIQAYSSISNKKFDQNHGGTRSCSSPLRISWKCDPLPPAAYYQ